MARSSAEATVTELPVKRDPFDFPVRTKVVTYKDYDYTFRELTLAENDEIRELATDSENKYDARLAMRLTIVNSAVDPKLDMEQLSKFPSTLYAKVYEAVNDLHDPDLDESDPGKA